MSVIPWVSIEGVNHVLARIEREKREGLRTAARSELERCGGCVGYRPKTKLHGANHAVVISDGRVSLQSRRACVDKEAHAPPKGGMGFAFWAANGEPGAFFQSLSRRASAALPPELRPSSSSPLAVFGEWCGPGIQPRSDVAVEQLPSRVFAVFSLRVGEGDGVRLIVDPEQILRVLTSGGRKLPPRMHVIPWMADIEETPLNLIDKPSLLTQVRFIEDLVNSVDDVDPWVRDVFSITGHGEGIVWYPVSTYKTTAHNGVSWSLMNEHVFESLAFKTKGSRFVTGEGGKPAPITLMVSQSRSPKDFVVSCLTEERLLQGLSTVCPGTEEVGKHHEEPFIDWIVGDVHKECELELAKSRIAWDQVDELLRYSALVWFQNKPSHPPAEQKQQQEAQQPAALADNPKDSAAPVTSEVAWSVRPRD